MHAVAGALPVHSRALVSEKFPCLSGGVRVYLDWRDVFNANGCAKAAARWSGGPGIQARGVVHRELSSIPVLPEEATASAVSDVKSLITLISPVWN